MRADGKKIKHVDPMYRIAPYIMERRYDAMNMITLDIPYGPIQSYINSKRKSGTPVSHMAVVIAAYLRTTCKYPAINRFIVNKKVYARNEFAVALVVLTPNDSVEDTMSKMYFKNTETIFEINKKINDYVEQNRNSPENNGTEKIMKVLLSVPGLVNVGVKFLKLMDRYGLIPKSVLDMSPFHNSLVISNLMSIRTNHIYHHCYDFGTTSLFITMGNLREVAKRRNGEIVFERCLPLGVVMDERICSGIYFSQAFREMKKYLKDPSLLETPPAEVIEDPGI